MSQNKVTNTALQYLGVSPETMAGLVGAKPNEIPGVAWSDKRIADTYVGRYAKNATNVQPAEGLPMASEDKDYLYVWLQAFIDLDMDCFHLLDVRRSVDGNETRRYVMVAQLAGGHHEYKTNDESIDFYASAESHSERLNAGLQWFFESIKEYW